VVPDGGGENDRSFFCSGDMAASMPNHVTSQKADNFIAAPQEQKWALIYLILYDYQMPHSCRYDKVLPSTGMRT
jgi:hypothetical protein